MLWFGRDFNDNKKVGTIISFLIVMSKVLTRVILSQGVWMNNMKLYS